MAVERLHFAPDASYHGFDASVHLARYAVARELCGNARVLDVACGEGYGTALLADWGAREVVGVDISAEAIAAATCNFQRQNTRYLCADAVATEDPLSSEAAFDLIVCFETFEHVSDPELLLRRLAEWRKPTGTIMISCPNDPAASRLGFSNEFHLRPWTSNEFRDHCEVILGPATAWLLEAPCVGAMILPEQNCRVETTGSCFSIMQARLLPAAQALPPQANVVPNWSDCLAYMGVWNAVPSEQLLASPVSYTAYMQPWANLNDQDFDARMLTRYDELSSAHRALQEQHEQDRQQLLRYASDPLLLRYEELSRAHRALKEQHEQDRQQLLRYASDPLLLRYEELESAHRALQEQREQDQDLSRRYDELARAHRALQDQHEQDRQQLLRYASGLVAPQSHRASSPSRVMRFTGSPRILKFYLWALRAPVVGRALSMLRRMALRGLAMIR